MQAVSFIAPNGARVNIRDWDAVRKAFAHAVVMQIIFNDPVFGA